MDIKYKIKVGQKRQKHCVYGRAVSIGYKKQFLISHYKINLI